MERLDIRLATPLAIKSLSPKDRFRAVIVVQDAFTTYFETQLVLDTLETLNRLGFQAYLAPYMPNGKPLHVHGFMKAFNKTASKNLDMLQKLSLYGLPFIGIDPSMTLTYRAEYSKLFADSRQVPKIRLMQEWLIEKSEHLIKQPLMCDNAIYHLMTHCTEKTNATASIKDWQKVYSILGLELKIENVGCCGMAGTYGHESENKETSKNIYDLSWKEKIAEPELVGKLVATGYSCRSQVKRFDDVAIPHPIQALLTHLREANLN